MKRILLSLLLIGLAWSPARAETCLSQSSPPSFPNAQPVPTVCDSHGTQKVMTVDEDGNYVAGGVGGTATLTEQETQTTHLSAIETAVEALDASIPAAAALADATSNPTTTGVAAYNMCFNGTTWDRCVKGTGGSGTVDSATARTTEATDSQLSADVAAIKTAVQLIDDDQTGASIKHFVTAGSTEDETEVKGSAGRLISVQASNSAATVAYLRCANQVAASTTPGTTTVFWGMAVPGATTGAGVVANFGPMGIAFSTGLTCWVVGGKAETDVAEVGANDVQVNIQYK